MFIYGHGQVLDELVRFVTECKILSTEVSYE